MKKVFYSLAATLYFMAIAQAQCPTKIVDNGMGSSYELTLTSLAQCMNLPNGSIVTLNTIGNYGVADCGDLAADGIITLQLTFDNGTPVVLATSAPITISGGGLSMCMYNSMGNPITLPIELIDFKGTSSVSGNVLTWTTVREVSNRGFQVERLVSDKTWLPISFVKSKGAYGKYEFTDNNPLPTSYYRLRQLDNDGTETFSKIVTVATKGINKLKAYPNPVLNVLTVEYTEGSLFQVINLLSQQVLVGKTAQQLDVSALPQGTYVLKVGTEVAKFVKQ